jgi:hypothetical protein
MATLEDIQNYLDDAQKAIEAGTWKQEHNHIWEEINGAIQNYENKRFDLGQQGRNLMCDIIRTELDRLGLQGCNPKPINAAKMVSQIKAALADPVN